MEKTRQIGLVFNIFCEWYNLTNFFKRFFFNFFLFFIISFFTCRNWANTLCSVTYWYQLIVETRFYVVLAEGNIGTKNHLVPVVFNRTKKSWKIQFFIDVEIRDNEHTFLHKRRSTSRAKKSLVLSNCSFAFKVGMIFLTMWQWLRHQFFWS